MAKVNTPEQAKAIANMKARDRRRLSLASEHTDRDFPKWRPGMTTSGYCRIFAIRCLAPLDLDWNRIAERPAPYLTPEQDAVEFEEVAE